MAAPETLVYRGAEGTGAAQIFGREGNPMRAYMVRKGDIERKRAIAAEEARLQKEKRDKKLWELINVSPESGFEPFNKQIIDAADTHRGKITQYLENGGNPDDPSFQRWVKRGWDEVNDKARRSNYIKGQIQETRDLIQKNPYLMPEYYHGKINDTYLNPDGTAKNLDDINVDNIRDIYVTDPLGFNFTKYHKDFMGGLNDNMSNNITQKAINNGILTKDTEAKWKGNLYIADPTSPIGVQVDAQGNPVLNFTPELSQTYQNSETAKRAYEALARQRNLPVDEVIREQFQLNGGLQQNTRASFSKNSSYPEWMYNLNNPGLKPDEKNIANRVFEHIDNITNAFYSKDGAERTPQARAEAREALGHLIGSKFGSGTITHAELVPGTNKPGMSTILGRNIDNSPNDRLVFKVKSGTKGLEKLEEIDIEDEGAPATLWNNFLTAGYMGKKSIAFDAAAQELGVDPRGLYKGREYKRVNQEREQNTVNSWAKGENFGDLTTKQYEGKNITGATADRTWTGSFKGYKLKLEDGSEATISKDDYDTMTKIFRSPREDKKQDAPAKKEEKAADGETVKVRHPNGSIGKIPKSRLADALKAGFKEIK